MTKPAPNIRLIRELEITEVNKAFRDLQDAMFSNLVPQPVPAIFLNQTVDFVLDATVSTAFQSVPGLTARLTQKGWWIISAGVTVDASGSGDPVSLQLSFLGAQIQQPSATMTAIYQLGGQWLIKSIAGNELIQIQAANTGAATVTLLAWNGTRGYGSMSATFVSIG